VADINQVITWGIGTPAGVLEFLTLGLQIGAEITAYTLSGDVKIRMTATADTEIRHTASGIVSIRGTSSNGVEL